MPTYPSIITRVYLKGSFERRTFKMTLSHKSVTAPQTTSLNRCLLRTDVKLSADDAFLISTENKVRVATSTAEYPCDWSRVTGIFNSV